jgi:hypothetical protein
MILIGHLPDYNMSVEIKETRGAKRGC